MIADQPGKLFCRRPRPCLRSSPSREAFAFPAPLEAKRFVRLVARNLFDLAP
jgi:hypothetical protein